MYNLFFYFLVGVALVIGLFVGYFARKIWAKSRQDAIEIKIRHAIDDAKAKQKDILLKAQDRSIKILEDAKEEIRQKQNEFSAAKKRLEQRESLFDQKLLNLENQKQDLVEKAEKINHIKAQVEKIREEATLKLEEVSGLTKNEAEQRLMSNVEERISDNLSHRIRKLEQEASEEWDSKAKEMLTIAMQRCASSHAQEITSSVVELPNDDMKGRIIGREGRNIRTFEQLTGVEVIVDDTPRAITLSSFSPIRRQVAKGALERLILDGRIHPARIEETIADSKKELAIEIKKAGEAVLYELGIAGFDPKLVQVLGRLKYRTSYGQNILDHSVEVAHLCTLLAEQLGADVSIAKRSGLFHDIGKAVDHEIQGTHPEIGRDILKKFGMGEDIIAAAEKHHDDKTDNIYVAIVKVADALSGARVGARKDTYENYLQRLEDLEKIANSFTGVERSYAIQAGREIRTFVIADEVDDLGAHKMARDIAEKIEEELKYPGEIKVSVIREMRVTEFAR